MSELVAVRPIRTEQDYAAALEEVGRLMTARAGTPEGDRLDVLSTLLEAYEAEHHAIEAPDPIALVEFAMEQKGIDRAALEPMIGSRGRVSEVLNRQRSLSLSMIRSLKDGLKLPADVLVRSYPLKRTVARTGAVKRSRSGTARRTLVA
jgi:HTH-type transcriptional regulator/antitoxin HigA